MEILNFTLPTYRSYLECRRPRPENMRLYHAVEARSSTFHHFDVMMKTTENCDRIIGSAKQNLPDFGEMNLKRCKKTKLKMNNSRKVGI